MKTDFLKELGLNDEQIASIMKENGSDIQREKEKLTTLTEEVERYKNELQSTKDALKNFEGVNVDELKGQINQLNETLAKSEQEFQSKLAERDFNDLVNKAITELGGKSDKAIRAMLDLDSLKESKNQMEDIKNAITACKNENDFLFGSNEPIQNPVGATGGKLPNQNDEHLSQLYKVMGIDEPKK